MSTHGYDYYIIDKSVVDAKKATWDATEEAWVNETDHDANGVHKCCRQFNSKPRQNRYPDAGTKERIVLKVYEGTDVSGCYLSGLTKYDHAGILVEMAKDEWTDPDQGL